MADVTFGVKVTEEMKQEITEMMKDSSLSGKEFMGLLLASYKLEQSKQESDLFKGDLRELQGLLKRVQSLYLNIIEKSSLYHEEQLKGVEEKIQDEKIKLEESLKEQDHLKIALEESAIKQEELQKQVKHLKEETQKVEEEKKELKQQLSNHLLLHTKYEEELQRVKEEVEGYKRLEDEIEERNEECSKIKNRNDELASEIWFLQREIEKLNEDKEHTLQKHQKELEQLRLTHELRLKNELLEQKLSLKEEIGHLQNQMNDLKEEKRQIEQSFHNKLQEHYKKVEK